MLTGLLRQQLCRGAVSGFDAGLPALQRAGSALLSNQDYEHRGGFEGRRYAASPASVSAPSKSSPAPPSPQETRRGLETLTHPSDSASSSAVSERVAPADLDFNNAEAIFAGQSTTSLLRALVVFKLCGVKAFVNNADQLLVLSKAVLGKPATTWIVKHTFFAHFCAGETDPEVWRTMRRLSKQGIGAILDYAAEDDVDASHGSDSAKKSDGPKQKNELGSVSTSTATPPPSSPAGTSPTSAPSSTASSPSDPEVIISPLTSAPLLGASRAVARQYDYQSEQQCDAHVETFLKSINTAAGGGQAGMQGFTAVKLTALGHPVLLERISSAITEVRGLFKQFDTDGSGFIDRTEFEYGYRQLLPDAGREEHIKVFRWMDTQGRGQLDYVGWCQRLSLTKMPQYAARMIQAQQTKMEEMGVDEEGVNCFTSTFQLAALTDQEVGMVENMRARLVKLAKAAAEKGVKLMVDAEHTYFQPAIDHLTLELMRTYNVAPGGAVIYNTYQAYLTDAHARLVDDLERSKREGYTLGAKLVRGAYMELERRRAAQLGIASPVWPTIDDTHASYHKCMELLLKEVKEGRAEVLLGTHNQYSVELAVQRMWELELSPSNTPVYWGQLLGMSDHLTQVLGQAGYKASKYVPYGKVEQVLPYLLRRAAENSSVLGGTKRDVQLLSSELWRRATTLGR